MKGTRIAMAAAALAAGIFLGAEEAPPDQETINRLEARVAELKQEISQLEVKIEQARAATQEAAKAVPGQLERLPKDLWPATGESALKVDARGKWYTDTLAGTEVDVKKTTVDTAGTVGKGAYLRTKSLATPLFGLKIPLAIYAEFDESQKASLVQIKTGDTVTIHGTISRVVSSPTAITVYLKYSTLVK